MSTKSWPEIKTDFTILHSKLKFIRQVSSMNTVSDSHRADLPSHRNPTNKYIQLFSELKSIVEQQYSEIWKNSGVEQNRAALDEILPGTVHSGTTMYLYLEKYESMLNSCKNVIDQLDHLISEQEEYKGKSILALHHLQRLIAVDPEYQKKWRNAFDDTTKSETTCEKYGALHFLWHGIWAFKAYAEKGRTDLILGEITEKGRMDLILGKKISEDNVKQSGAKLLLTEWKVFREGGDFNEVKQKLKEQLNKYKDGPLLGIELKDICYGIIVTDQIIKEDLLSDSLDSGRRIKYFVLNVTPKIPSE